MHIRVEATVLLQVSNHHTVMSSGECESSCREKHVTWRELSITRAKPNFESLILMDHFWVGKKRKIKNKNNNKRNPLPQSEREMIHYRLGNVIQCSALTI